MPLTLSKRAQVVPQVKISPPENLVLDNFAIRPAATFNLRRTTRHYDGAMVTVRGTSSIVPRRVFKSDVRGDLDIRALLAFIGNGSGFVDRWNNPNDSSRDAVQATGANQPRIVSGGVLDTRNGKPSIVFDGVTSFLSATPSSYSGSFTLNLIIAPDSSMPSFGMVLVLNANVTEYRRNGAASHMQINLNGGSAIQDIPSGFDYRITSALVSGTSQELFTNGVLVQSTSIVFSPLINSHSFGGRSAGSFPYKGSFQEMVLFHSLSSTIDRQLLERDQAKYFSILGVA